MKKLTSLLLILVLIALCAPAFATDTNGRGDTVARSAELAAFLDGSGNIYVSGMEQPVNATKADSLVSIDPYRILFFAQENAAANIPQGRLVALSLNGFSETVVTDDAYAACLDAENVYYISKANRAQLVCRNLDSGESRTVYTATESLDRIYSSSIGVITSLVDGAGAYITDSITGQFVPFAGDVASKIEKGDGFEVYLAANNNLYVQQNGALTSALVDSSVRAWAIIDHNIFYLTGNDGALGLKQYNVDNNLWSFLLTLPADIEPQLTASENALFTLSSNNVIYRVDVANHRLVNYTNLLTPQSYSLSGTRSVTSYRIEAVSGQLNVYGVVQDSTAQPTFTFGDFGTAAVQSSEPDIVLLSAYAIDTESTVWDLLQPAPQFSTLRRGSRGDAVSAIQQPLRDLDYYDYYIDGIFGWRTERAVELLQDALGLPVTGVADEDLQRRILAGGLPAYDPYRELERGDRGLRVREMQERLRDLGYLADDADGIFGSRTEAAVELFQSENGLRATGVANADTLRKLYSSNAQSCSSYIELRRGDTGYRVRELNRRLKALYYLEGKAGSTYTSATAEAVRRFQDQIGMRQTGVATIPVQRELFSSDAPEYSGYITLRRGDDNGRVQEMQRRLYDLGYFTGDRDGYFGKDTEEAVRAFQRRAGLKATGEADPATLEALYSPDAPEYQEPEKLTDPVIELRPDFETDENGVYLIPVETGEVGIYWTADGGVDCYDIYIGDSDGNTFIDRTNTQDEMVLFSSSDSLREDVIYTVTVTAHPVDTDYNSDTHASIRFRVVPKPTVVNSVTINVTSDFKMDAQDEELYVFTGETVSCNWIADGEVEHFEYDVTDGNGDVVAGGSDNPLEMNLNCANLSQGMIYTLTVNAYPHGGGESASASLRFRVAGEADATPVPTAEPTLEPTAEPTQEPVEATQEPSADVTQEPAAEATQEPAGVPDEDGEQPGAVNGVPALQIAPATGEVQMEITAPDGSVATVTVVTVGEGSLELNWPAEGDVVSYYVQITDSNGNLMADQSLLNSGATVGPDKLIPGEIYTLTVTATFVNGDPTSATAYFMLPAVQETEAPEAEPTAESVAEIYAQQPYAVESYEEEPYSENSYEEEAPADDAYVDDSYVDDSYEDDSYVDESYEDESYEDEPYEDESYEEEPVEDSGSAYSTITRSSDSSEIDKMQKKLYDWGWLTDYSSGSLDDATIQAVIDFQNYCNGSGYNLKVTDPDDPKVEIDTLELLFEGSPIQRP